MIKTLRNLFKQDKEKFVVPKSVQAVIPLKTVWEDGIFLVGKNKYAKTFKFEDINYAVASREDKEAMFLEYSELLNALDSGATTKITINNCRLNKADFEQTILIPLAQKGGKAVDDGLDKYRKEYNKMLLDKATGANSIVQDKYVTISVCKKNIEERGDDKHYSDRPECRCNCYRPRKRISRILQRAFRTEEAARICPIKYKTKGIIYENKKISIYYLHDYRRLPARCGGFLRLSHLSSLYTDR